MQTIGFNQFNVIQSTKLIKREIDAYHLAHDEFLCSSFVSVSCKRHSLLVECWLLALV